MASDRLSSLTLLLLVPCVALWDAQLTDKLFGEQNRKIAADAEAAGEQNWTEMGVGVDANGEAYIQQIARGKVFKHIRAGLLLVATGQVDGSIFDQSVILLVKHDSNGTLGLMLNKPAPFPADEHLEPSCKRRASTRTNPAWTLAFVCMLFWTCRHVFYYGGTSVVTCS